MDAVAVLLGAVGVLLVAVLALLPWLRASWRLYTMMRRLPGPPGLPLVGNLFDVLTSDPYENFCRLCDEYRRVMRFWVSPAFSGVFLMEPPDIQAILGKVTFVDKPSAFYNTFAESLSPGLAFHPHHVWKPIRTAMVVSMHKSVLSTFVPTLYRNAAASASQLEKEADLGSTFDITHICGSATHHSVIDTVLSSDGNDISDEERCTFVDVLGKENEILVKRLWRPWLHPDVVFSRTKYWKDHQHFLNFVKNLVRRVVTRKKNLFAQEKLESKQPQGRQSFLDHLISLDPPFSGDLEVETRFIMIAGSASSMDTLVFIYYTLAIQPNWQAALVKELDEVFGGDPLRPVEEEDLPRLDLTERYIKEVLRFFPALPVFARHVPVDVDLPSGHTLPRGSTAAFFLPAVHRDPRWWERPEEFDPDRFLPENSRGRHPFAFIPFSAGPRNCVAVRYTMMLLKTHVATVLRRVELLPAPGAPSRVRDIPITMQLTLAVRGGARVRVKRREPAARGRV